MRPAFANRNAAAAVVGKGVVIRVRAAAAHTFPDSKLWSCRCTMGALVLTEEATARLRIAANEVPLGDDGLLATVTLARP